MKLFVGLLLAAFVLQVSNKFNYYSCKRRKDFSRLCDVKIVEQQIIRKIHLNTLSVMRLKTFRKSSFSKLSFRIIVRHFREQDVARFIAGIVIQGCLFDKCFTIVINKIAADQVS